MSSEWAGELRVVGIGSSRDACLAYADKQAVQWFGSLDGVTRYDADEARVSVVSGDGAVILFEMDVDYKRGWVR